jgi:integrase
VWTRMPYAKTHSDYIRARLPVTHWGPHDLRRSCRTLLASMGCPSEVGEALLGHVQPGIEGVYNLHTYDAERLAWLTKLSAKLEELAAGSTGTQTR